jgi:hypothetical protein
MQSTDSFTQRRGVLLRSVRVLPRACLWLTLGLTASALTAGAAAPPGRPYEGRSVCCNDPSEFQFVALPERGRIDFDIDRKTPVFEFQNGYSVYRAFRLPVLMAPYLLEVRSYLRQGPDPSRAQVLYPMAALLSDDYLVMRSIGLESLTAELPILERTDAPAYRLTIPIDPVHGRERYLVLFTPFELVAPGREPAAAATAETATDLARDAFLGASTEGHLSITVVTGHGASSSYVH